MTDKHTTGLTDEEIERNQEELRQRLAKAPDARTEQANEHVRGIAIVNEITGQLWQPGPYESFLSGWDDAMEMKHADLAKEIEEVRGKFDDLVCERFQAEKIIPVMLAACKELLEVVDEAYQATGYIKVAKTSEQRLRLESAIALAEAHQ